MYGGKADRQKKTTQVEEVIGEEPSWSIKNLAKIQIAVDLILKGIKEGSL